MNRIREVGLVPARAEITFPDIQAYWPLESTLGDPLAGNHGVLRGTLLKTEFVDSPLGRGLRLDGKDQWVEIPGELKENYAAFSVALWVKHEGKEGTLLFRGDESWYLNVLADGTVENQQIKIPQALRKSQWHHLVLINRLRGPAGDSALYLDGLLMAESETIFRGIGLGGFGNDPVYKGRLTLGCPPGHRSGPFEGAIDDVLYCNIALDASDVARLWNEGKGRRASDFLADAEANGLPDAWEAKHGLKEGQPNKGRAGDADGDGLNNSEEWRRGTDPTKTDTDEDGLGDAQEIQTSPVGNDSDNDGLVDGQEAPRKLDVLSPDSDGDKYSDGDELKAGSDPTQRESVPDIGFGLKAYWPFEDSFGDQAGRFHGVPSESKPSFVDGLVKGKALRFAGNKEYLDVKDGGEFRHDSKSFSIALWFEIEGFPNPDGGDTFRSLVAASSPGSIDSNPDNWGLSLAYDRNPTWDSTASMIRFTPGEQQAKRLVRVSPFDLVGPRHVVAVYDQSLPPIAPTALYFNGEKQRYYGSSGSIPNHGNGQPGFRLGSGYVPWPSTARLTLDEVAVWSRALTSSEAKMLYEARLPLSELIKLDGDGDGLPSAWEREQGLDPNVKDAEADLDADGLSNAEEFRLGTHPRKADTDNDGAPDKSETGTGKWTSLADRGTNPLLADSDGDALADGAEIPDAQAGSDPNRMDTDGDGLDDGSELKWRSDPAKADSLPSLAAGLIAHWPFDSDTTDRVGQRKAKAVKAAVHEVAKHGRGVYFDGQSQALEVADPKGDFSLTRDGFTLSAWIRQDPYETEGNTILGIAYKGRGSQKWALMATIGQEATDSHFGFTTFGWLGPPDLLDTMGYPKLVLDGTFHHVAFVSNAASKSVTTYLDVKSGVKPPWQELEFGGPLVIGKYGELDAKYPDTSVYWKGVIDDLAIWRRVLTESELRLLVESGKSLAELVPVLDPVRPSTDSDHDGMSDQAEAIAGTDPRNPADRLRITSIERTRQMTRVTWATVPGKRYQLQFTHELAREWRPVSPSLTAEGKTLSAEHLWEMVVYEDPEEPGKTSVFGGSGYYRVQVVE